MRIVTQAIDARKIQKVLRSEFHRETSLSQVNEILRQVIGEVVPSREEIIARVINRLLS